MKGFDEYTNCPCEHCAGGEGPRNKGSLAPRATGRFAPEAKSPIIHTTLWSHPSRDMFVELVDQLGHEPQLRISLNGETITCDVVSWFRNKAQQMPEAGTFT